jgi:hypothetical protein
MLRFVEQMDGTAMTYITFTFTFIMKIAAKWLDKKYNQVSLDVTDRLLT